MVSQREEWACDVQCVQKGVPYRIVHDNTGIEQVQQGGSGLVVVLDK